MKPSLKQKVGKKEPTLAIAACIRKPAENIDSDKVFKSIGEEISKLEVLNSL